MDRARRTAAQVKKLGMHLAAAAAAGVDVLRETVADRARQQAEYTVIIAGNDNCGKTSLLYNAKFGPKFNKKLIVPTVGHNLEELEFRRTVEGKNTLIRLELFDLGGGKRMGPFFYKYMADADALLFVVRSGDPRFVSAMWELYLLVYYASFEGARIHVTVLVIGDDPHTAMMCRLARRDALPPTRGKWSELMSLYEYSLDAWSSDRAWTEAHNRTASHGMPLPRSATPPDLVAMHSGTWTVLAVADVPAQDAALQPFADLVDKLTTA
jgi:hypothetical protein